MEHVKNIHGVKSKIYAIRVILSSIHTKEREYRAMKVADPSPVESKPPLQPSRGQARFAFSVLLVINILNYADRFVLPAILRRIQASPAQGGLGLTNFEADLICP